ncbi:MAG TPA: AbrB/MazE/SpoVT family DNA-binding domain-containing protein [Candidatus Sulfotelmatobacter sp.]|jgi:AbrB family looped-hinge helix DNA binding protein|nr:AbrB/MazE/SpoVT family DNA-binding domain-containing protein [Candidatus Sulfotelmatobacter sp.]
MQYCHSQEELPCWKTRIKVNESGRVVVPAAFRKALGIDPGGEVIPRMEDGELRITTMKRSIVRAQRHARKYIKPGVSLKVGGQTKRGKIRPG